MVFPGGSVRLLCVHNDTPMVFHKFLDQLHGLHVFYFFFPTALLIIYCLSCQAALSTVQLAV